MIRWLRAILEWIKNLFAKKTMRRKITLYIDEQLVDLDDQSFILFNYQMDDLSNPTIVKNSFSQQITLKGTPANNRIFGGYFRTDRQIGNTGGESGIDFNASQKTPFTIYDEMGQILQSGYVKLDSIDRHGADIQYHITLYGGLGSFFYALSYDGNGNRRSLASLDYLGTSNPESELDFVINAATIQAAWNRLINPGDGTLTPQTIHTSKYLAADGSLVNAVSTHRVSDYIVDGISDVLMTGRIPRYTDSALAVAMDANNVVVGVYGLGTGEAAHNVSDFPATLPGNAHLLRVYSYDSASIVKYTTNQMWDVINFAPAYNGIPDGNFSANKALVIPSDVGLQDTITKDGVNYTLKSGYALVSLAESQDEWAVKDLRSYLQRPVLSMKAFWTAICNPENNGGYEVDASIIQDYLQFHYSDLWMTLPMIPSIGSVKKQSGDLTLTMSSSPTDGNAIGRYDIGGGSVPAGTKVTANVSCRIRFNVSGANAYNALYPSATHQVSRQTQTKFDVVFIQAVAYASDDSVVGGSNIKVLTSRGGRVSSSIAAACGYAPAWAADYEDLVVTQFTKIAAGSFEIPAELGFTIEAQDVAYYKILVSVYDALRVTNEGGGGSQSSTSYSGDGSKSTPAMYVDYETYFTPSESYIIQGASGNSVTYTSSESLRSGATITKAMLLSSSHTPAEYMLSFCKVFGLYFSYDNDTRKVTILRRNDLYQDETIDLTRRVDLSKGISIQPMVFQAKWYDFILEGVGGAFYDEYLNTEGIQYGIQRVNTGYDFDADSVNLMDSVVFKNACTILARSKYFNIIQDGNVFIPSPFLDKGNKYTLWNANGDTLDTDISCPPASASVTYMNDNPNYTGYDVNGARKLELRDASNKPVDGSDILVFLEGWNQYPYFKVSDDVPGMDALNEGVPCWLLGAGQGVNIPIFQRYLYGNIRLIERSLDFGVPRQFDIPGVKINPGSTIYEKGWEKYISDRYDANTKVMTCRVDFSGIKVSQDLLRKFYWYDNSIWVLNAIRNYSLTTYDPVECEFVQVQDKDNYLNGQSY